MGLFSGANLDRIRAQCRQCNAGRLSYEGHRTARGVQRVLARSGVDPFMTTEMVLCPEYVLASEATKKQDE